jgi:hypothetical protein
MNELPKLPKPFMKSGENNEAAKDAKSPDQESEENGLVESVISPSSGKVIGSPLNTNEIGYRKTSKRKKWVVKPQ